MRFRRTKRLAIAITGLIFVTGSVAWTVGTGFVQPYQRAIGSAPADLHASTVLIPSASGSLLHGWFAEAPGGKAAIALFHGIHSSRLAMLTRARLFRQAGYSVLLIDFQGNGESPGQQVTFGYRESKDVEASIAWLHQRLPQARVGAIGVSMGGAALALAKHPLKLDAVVLESAYSTIDRAVENRVVSNMGVLGEAVWPLLTVQLEPRVGIRTSDLRPIDHLADVGCPILIAGGAADRYTVASETEHMYAAAHSPKEFWLVPKADHVDLQHFAPEDYQKHVFAFLNRYLCPSSLAAGGL